jgi:DNA-binding NarL/FixJ family response regulator
MKIRVLVIDDFPLARDGLIASLQADDSIDVVGEAADGVTGLALAHSLQPDVAMVDMNMPGLAGPALIARFRDELPECPIVVLSASESADTMLDAISAGAAGYLTKRAGGRELRHAVLAVQAGGSIIAPSLAASLLQEYSEVSRGEPTTRPVLPRREQEILRLLVDGRTDREIGAQLYVSVRTVQNSLTKIREKTGLRRRSELARWAIERALT